MVKKGIVLYDIQLDGSLTGVYLNEHVALSEPVGTEIARPHSRVPHISGDYDCMYFDQHTQVSLLLEIRRLRRNPRVLQFRWRENSGGIVRFRGTGYQVNHYQIAVRYRSA